MDATAPQAALVSNTDCHATAVRCAHTASATTVASTTKLDVKYQSAACSVSALASQATRKSQRRKTRRKRVQRSFETEDHGDGPRTAPHTEGRESEENDVEAMPAERRADLLRFKC